MARSEAREVLDALEEVLYRLRPRAVDLMEVVTVIYARAVSDAMAQTDPQRWPSMLDVASRQLGGLLRDIQQQVDPLLADRAREMAERGLGTRTGSGN